MHQTSDTEEAMVTEFKKKKKKIPALLPNLPIALPQGTERHNTILTGCTSGNFVTTFTRDHGVRI